MKNLSILLDNRPGALADMGEALDKAGVSVEGGGMFVMNGTGIANFLVEDADAGRRALEDAGIKVTREDDVVLLKLNQDESGQLGKLLRRMAQADVNVTTQYSDHNHQLVLVVDDLQSARRASDQWMAERAAPKMNDAFRALPGGHKHHYAVEVTWTGNIGSGTATYAGYERRHTISALGKAIVYGSSDPAFRGDGSLYNPEELLVASVSACHMLTYLHLCAVNKIVVSAYQDRCTGQMKESVKSSGALTRINLEPEVTISPECDLELAEALHEQAHHSCFIANSIKTTIVLRPKLKRGSC